ncbi:biopolymer transporter ExbD [Aurantivibrio plasticivorans]
MQQYHTEQEEMEVNMTPMLDIVFIMLIFFIVTAVFVKDPGVEINRPDASNAQTVKRLSAVVAVDDDNSIWVDKQQVTLTALRIVATQLKQENPKGKIVVQADERSDSRTVVAIVQMLNNIGFDGVAVATKAGGV